MMIAVLVTMLFQSAHSTEHLFQEYFQQDTSVTHLKEDGTTKFTALKTAKHSCSICEFTLSSIISPEIFSFHGSVTTTMPTATFAKEKTALTVFTGTLTQLRAPPAIS